MKVCKRCGECIANIVCGINIPPGASECETFTRFAEALKPSHNSQSDAIALCKRAVMYSREVGDIPQGHPIIDEMAAVVAQQHT